MKFEPTNNYYGLDFSIEENVVKWNFWEFMKNLVALSSSAKVQKEVIGFGAVADELAEDFDTYYTLQKRNYIKHDLLDSKLIDELDELDQFFDTRSGRNETGFWNDELLDQHQDWEQVRHMALRILKQCGYENLEITIERSTNSSVAEDGTPVLVESTKTKLRRKNNS